MKKILVFRHSNLGDYFLAIASLRLLRKKYPKSYITYMTAKNRKNFSLPDKIGNEVLVDEFIFLKKKNYKDIFGLKNTIKKIKKKNFDILVYLQEYSTFLSLTKHYLFFLLCRISQNIGFKDFFKKKDYRKYSETILITRRISNNLTSTKIRSLMNIKKFNEKRLIKKNYITLGPGGFALGRLPEKIKTERPKKWNNNNWHTLVKLLVKKNKNIKIVFTGTQKEKNLSEQIKKKYKNNIINTCGKTNIKSWINIIRFSDLHICQDNGSMHLCTIFQKKNVSIFNNHDFYGKWFPLNKNAKILRLEGDINTIQPNNVYEKVKKLLNKR